ncbi:hypothetical protein BK762_20010 [Bacillus thuringiensis serovar toumanoffi]|nr:hypothetical protein BK762_20010 [Bacillus thuringiensis serovar toumanoffi]
MNIYKFTKVVENEILKCLFFDTKRYRLVFALSETLWYSKIIDLRRYHYIEWDRKRNTLFLFKLAIKWGRRNDEALKK